MFLYEAKESQEWVNQFEPEDKPLAEKLLSSLRIVTSQDFQDELDCAFESLIAKISGPASLYSIRETDGANYFTNKKNKPLSNSGKNIGSEGKISTWITQKCRSSTMFKNHASISWLKRNRIHDIILVDDFSGSGQRVIEFLNCFKKNKTICSWSSSGLLNFHILCHSMTDLAESLIKKQFVYRYPRKGFPKGSVNYSRIIGKKSWGLDEVTLDAIEKLCRKYHKVAKITRENPLGHKSAMSNIVFDHGVPNNTPPILWEATDVWKPIFPGRTIPRNLRSWFTRLKQSINKTQGVFLVLMAIKRGIHKEEYLSQSTGVTPDDCHSILKWCLDQELISNGNYLTRKGSLELSRAQKQRKKKENSDSSYRHYYPKSIRGPS